MVAYSFAPQFRDLVASGIKTQTVRADRKRHARPGEPLQLYAAMRTKYCRKLVTPDPVVTRVRPIQIIVTVQHVDLIASIAFDDTEVLNADEIEAFANADGFPALPGFARRKMGDFWLKAHGQGRFRGVLIEWTRPEITHP